MEFNVGDIIKINSEIFTTDDVLEIVGDLGYPVPFKELEFRIVKNDYKNSNGDYHYIVEVVDIQPMLDLLGAERVEMGGTWHVMHKDAVPSVNKLKIDYVLNVGTVDKKLLEKQLKQERAESQLA